jgi:hypothetical protein
MAPVGVLMVMGMLSVCRLLLKGDWCDMPPFERPLGVAWDEWREDGM